MKRPIKKKTKKINGIRKKRYEIKELVHDCLVDIEWYIVDDIMRYLKKRGLL